MNGDGKKQLLVNNWEKKKYVNGVWAYTVPDDITGGEYQKYPITTGFKMSWKYFFTGIGGPGYPYVFYPDGNENRRAHILLAGHGDNKMYLLTPTGDANQFEYERDMVVNGRAVIPYIEFADLDEDGYSEVYMANY